MAKRPGAGGILLVAVILGLVTAYVVYGYIRNIKKSSEENWRPVVVATVDIGARKTVTRDMIKITKVPETSRVLFLRRFRQEWGQRLGLPRAGLEEVVAAASEQLGIRYGVEVTSIEGKRGAPVQLILSERGPGGDRQLRRQCDAVVVATCAAEARRIAAPILEPAERDVLGRMKTTPSVALFLRLRRPFHSHCKLIRVPHDEGSPIENVLLEPGARGGRAPEGRGLATIRATGAFGRECRALPIDVVEKTLLDAFETFQPGARKATESTRLFRIESAASHFGVGHFREIARLERVLTSGPTTVKQLFF